MFTGENIICVSSIDWDFVWQGHQEIMSAFAKAGNRVLFIENTGIRTPSFRDIPRLKKRLTNWKKGVGGIRKEAEGIYVYSPLILPFPYSRFIKPINRMLFVHNVRKWMSAADFANPIIWTFLPTNVTLDLIDNVENKKLIVYYCIAEFSQLVKSSKKVEKAERELLERCDLVFAQGERIKERCLKHNKNVHIFPFGVSNEVFLNFDEKNSKVPEDITGIKKPILGYVGGIHKHMDTELLKEMAGKRPDWSIVLVGPMQIECDSFKGFKNIHFLGKKDHKALPSYIVNFDVCLIPYVLNEYTKTVYPTKLNEYLSMGKPVVATSIPEVDRFNEENKGVIEVASDRKSFYDKVENALKLKSANETQERRKEVASNSDWGSRIECMTRLMEESMERRYRERALKWREEFAMAYKTLARRIVKISLILALVYLIAFKTPLLWFVASPLKVSEVSRKADAIVVFAGGVGESGKAGQGYEERVKKAVDLYKDGYAPHIIFLSGYTYTFQEADVMKALAVSLGVPKKAIILEKEAGNTYSYAKYAGRIAGEHGWKEILLVSSPYNMRRAMLCFESLYPELTVIPTPIDISHFYIHGLGAAPAQYKAIMHEYLGILYYIVRGEIKLGRPQSGKLLK